jgi:hypothetical protein
MVANRIASTGLSRGAPVPEKPQNPFFLHRSRADIVVQAPMLSESAASAHPQYSAGLWAWRKDGTDHYVTCRVQFYLSSARSLVVPRDTERVR